MTTIPYLHEEDLRIGDHIIQMENCCDNLAGHEYLIGICNGTRLSALTDVQTGKILRDPCCCNEKWILKVEPKKQSLIKTIMKTLNNMEKLLLDPDSQKLKKAGFINGDLDITMEGMKELQFILFKANKAELVKRAEEVIAEKEAEDKKS
jgi:hypothetical protein